MNLPSDPWPKITTIQFILHPKLHNVRFIFSFSSIQLSARNALYRSEGKRKVTFWLGALVRCGKAAASAISRCVSCPCANIPGVTDREVWERLAAAAVWPYLLINIAVVCTTFGSSMCICMIIHPIHFPWSTRESGEGGGSGWHPPTPAPACTWQHGRGRGRDSKDEPAGYVSDIKNNSASVSLK